MAAIYQFLIEIEGSTPAVWRRVQIPENANSFRELHDIIRILMDWPFADEYEFQINGVQIYDFIGAVDLGNDHTKRHSNDTFLDEFISPDQSALTFYYYHEGEWRLPITVEKVLADTEDFDYPVCTEGEGAGPPVECAGIEDYKELLKGLSDLTHPRNRDAHDMLGEEWNPHFFNQYKTNYRLRDYAEQWEAIVENVREASGQKVEEQPVTEYDQLKSLEDFEDLVKDEEENLRMMGIVEDCLQDTETESYQTFTRLKNKGMDEQKVKALIRDVLAIEEFYEIKHGIMELPERFSYNLQNLPGKPHEIPDTRFAVQILDACSKGIPYKAIEYLQQDQSEEARNTILQRIEQIIDENYAWNDPVLNPLFYTIAAEGHICEGLIDPVIALFTHEHPCQTDILNEQGEILNEMLAEQFPDLVIPKVIEAVKKVTQKSDQNIPVLYLYNALFFGDLTPYEKQLLAVLKDPYTPYHDSWADKLAHRQIQSAKPIIESFIRKMRSSDAKENEIPIHSDTKELEESLEELKSGESLYPDVMKPEIRNRGNWKEHYAGIEPNLYEDDPYDEDFEFDFPFPGNNPDDNAIEQEASSGSPGLRWGKSDEPKRKEVRPGRNDPCHCGSGKKYKKCCLQKDEEGFRN